MDEGREIRRRAKKEKGERIETMRRASEEKEKEGGLRGELTKERVIKTYIIFLYFWLLLEDWMALRVKMI